MQATPKKNTRQRRNRILAFLSAGLVLGVGATYTLASWNDSEFVFGGIDGLATSTFEVEQNRGDGWDEFETADGGEMTFSLPALALTPGDSTYAGVQLRTTAASIGGQITLSSAVQSANATSDPTLWAELGLRVVVTETDGAGTPVCNATSFGAGADYVVGSETGPAALDAAGLAPSVLDAEAGNAQAYCFEVSLPDPVSVDEATLMGVAVTPVWEFVGVSD